MKNLWTVCAVLLGAAMFGPAACGGDENDDNSMEDGGDMIGSDGSDQGAGDSESQLIDPFVAAGYSCPNTDTTLCDSTACSYDWRAFATQDCTNRQAYCDATTACISAYVECLKTGCPPGQTLGPETGPASMDCGSANGTCMSNAQIMLQGSDN